MTPASADDDDDDFEIKFPTYLRNANPLRVSKKEKETERESERLSKSLAEK